MMTKKQFMTFVEQRYGYDANNWQSIKDKTPPLFSKVFTMGKDEGGYFTHINNEFLDGDEEMLMDLGVTHWQPAK